MPTTAVATATRTTWTIDAAHSNVEFSVRHLMIATARGRFAGVTGTVDLDEEDPSRSSIDVTIDAATVDTREAQRDTHLRSADFFDVEHYPVITFKTSKVERFLEDRYKAVGELTIRGVSRPVVLDITAEGRTRDPWGNDRAGFSATTKIKRSDFGLTWNQILEAGGVAVGDEVKISIDAELVRDRDSRASA
jgi:polyisoprenoid-binding protein YceI